MIDQRKRIFGAVLWVFDLSLTTASFFLAYSLRSLFELKDHTLMPIQVYLWLLAIILPTWALLMPLFRVYTEATLAPTQIGRLLTAVFWAWLVVTALATFVNPETNNRFILIFTLV